MRNKTGPGRRTVSPGHGDRDTWDTGPFSCGTRGRFSCPTSWMRNCFFSLSWDTGTVPLSHIEDAELFFQLSIGTEEPSPCPSLGQKNRPLVPVWDRRTVPVSLPVSLRIPDRRNDLMSELFDSGFLNKLERLALTAKMAVSDGAAGNRKSRSKGSSVEFSDYREYVRGDDFRRIDWNAYGRFEKLFIKLFMEEREAPVNIFLDTSKSMKWGDPDKSIAARRLAAALSYISLASYDRVTLYCISDRIVSNKPSLRGKNSFTRVLKFLEDVVFEGTTDLFAAVRNAQLDNNRGISVVISDFLSPGSPADLLKYLLYHRQEVYLCHLLSPQEIRPSVDKGLRLVDSETGEFVEVTPSSALLKTYEKVFENYINGIIELCFRHNVNYIGLTSDLPLEQMLKRVVSAT